MNHESFDIEGAWLAYQSFKSSWKVTRHHYVIMLLIYALATSGFLISINLFFSIPLLSLLAFSLNTSIIVLLLFLLTQFCYFKFTYEPEDRIVDQLLCRYWRLRITYYKEIYQEAFNKWNLDRTVSNQQLRNNAYRTLMRINGIAKSECPSLITTP